MAGYLQSLYADAMARAYAWAHGSIAAAIGPDTRVLECGAGAGGALEPLARRSHLRPERYRGIEWAAGAVAQGRSAGLAIDQGDLNAGLPYPDGHFGCVFGLSLLEHLANPCRFLAACHRVLEPGGTLVLLTPNIATYFTAALILAGKMPSSGPHPDSNELLRSEQVVVVNPAAVAERDLEHDTPMHRHLVVFSYRVLQRYLRMLGFRHVAGRGFGLYPFPRFAQPLLERLDPWHCHQMVFVARK